MCSLLILDNPCLGCLNLAHSYVNLQCMLCSHLVSELIAGYNEMGGQLGYLGVGVVWHAHCRRASVCI